MLREQLCVRHILNSEVLPAFKDTVYLHARPRARTHARTHTQTFNVFITHVEFLTMTNIFFEIKIKEDIRDIDVNRKTRNGKRIWLPIDAWQSPTKVNQECCRNSWQWLRGKWKVPVTREVLAHTQHNLGNSTPGVKCGDDGVDGRKLVLTEVQRRLREILNVRRSRVRAVCYICSYQVYVKRHRRDRKSHNTWKQVAYSRTLILLPRLVRARSREKEKERDTG